MTLTQGYGDTNSSPALARSPDSSQSVLSHAPTGPSDDTDDRPPLPPTAVGASEAAPPPVPERRATTTTNVKLSSSISSDNSNDASASSKVTAKSIVKRSGRGKDSNRDNKKSASGSISRTEDEVEVEKSVAEDIALLNCAAKSDESTSRRDVRNNGKSSSSSASDAEEEQDQTTGYPSSLSRSLKSDAAPLPAVQGEPMDQKGQLAAQSSNRNAISVGGGADRQEDGDEGKGGVGRTRNNGTMATNAKLIAGSHQRERTLGYNNITTAASSPETGLGAPSGAAGLARGGVGHVAANGSISETTKHRQSAVVVGGGGGNATMATRNKSGTGHNSIRALNHISDRKPFFGKHHHNNDK